MFLHESFWKVSETDRKRGYSQCSGGYICLLCGDFSERGVIYENEGVLCDAEKNTAVHIKKAHGSVFSYLVRLDKRLTGLSAHQSEIMKLFYEGAPETEIRKKLGIGSASTIRQHRFALREKERQAKIFTALAELLNESESTAKENRDRPENPTEKTYESGSKSSRAGAPEDPGKEATIRRYFPQSGFGRLKTLSMKEKSRLIVLEHIASRFRPGVEYTEAQINSALMEIYDDYVTLKRYLVDYRFMDRKKDGSLYWLIENETTGKDGKEMEGRPVEKKPAGEKAVLENSSPASNGGDDRKELKRRYKEIKLEGGVFAIKNKISGRMLVLSTPNLKTITGKIMSLKSGTHPNAELQSDWKRLGEESFDVEVLEAIDQKDENFTSKLEKIEKKWLEKLSPYGERGYNVPGRRY